MERTVALVSPFIDGVRVDSLSDDPFEVYSPYTGKRLFSYPAGSAADVDRAVNSARRAFDDGRWGELKPSVRRATIYRLADLIERHARELDELDAEEMGKPISVGFCSAAEGANLTRYCASAFDKIVGNVLVSDTPSYVTQRWVPRGVIGAIASWNFPTFVALLKSIPALATGNTVVLKPSEMSPSSALRIAELAVEGGVPSGVLNVIPGTGETVGRALGMHSRVDMITFTGSTKIGKLMLQYSGQSNMKKVLLECGGKSPHVVFDDDVNIDEVAETVSASILRNQGQVCSAGTRVIVHKNVVDVLTKKIAERFRAVKIGDPLDPQTNFGPLASRAQCQRVEAYISRAIESGADLVTGGRRVLREKGGYFIEPTLFTSVQPTASIAVEEIFGPVLPMISFQSEDEAVSIVNGTDFGLNATVWATEIKTGMRVAKRVRSSVTLRTGQLISEGAGYGFSSEPAGQSGLGIEGGIAGLESYQRRQTISMLHG